LLSFDPRLVAMAAGRVVYDGPASSHSLAWDGVRGSSQRTPHSPSSHAAPAVRAEDLRVGYDGDAVLRDVSLEIAAGQFVAVMGDSGSGKTTFLQSLLGFLQPSRGWVEVLGRDTRRIPVSQLARRVGFVFQNPDHQLFADSVWEEAIFGARNFGLLDRDTEIQVAGLLDRCGLGGRRDDHPYRLSYGEKRRLNLISVLAYTPHLLLLDEILIGQDAENAAFLLDLLSDRVERGGTVIWVNHAPALARSYATHLLFFADGRLLVDAPTDRAFHRLAMLGREAYLPRAGVER